MSNAELRDRVMDESGNLVNVGNPRKKLEGENRTIGVMREKIKNLESALKFKRSEITSMKQELREQGRNLKQENETLKKENVRLKANLFEATKEVVAEQAGEVTEDEENSNPEKSGFLGKINKRG